MDDGDLHKQILHIEAHIEKLADAIERCRKIILISKAAIAAGGTLILAMTLGAVRFDPTLMIGAIAVCYRRHRCFRVEQEYVGANYGRHESRRGTQSRVEQQNGFSGAGTG